MDPGDLLEMRARIAADPERTADTKDALQPAPLQSSAKQIPDTSDEPKYLSVLQAFRRPPCEEKKEHHDPIHQLSVSMLRQSPFMSALV
jgi:hypothetical protein